MVRPVCDLAGSVWSPDERLRDLQSHEEQLVHPHPPPPGGSSLTDVVFFIKAHFPRPPQVRSLVDAACTGTTGEERVVQYVRGCFIMRTTPLRQPDCLPMFKRCVWVEEVQQVKSTLSVLAPPSQTESITAELIAMTTTPAAHQRKAFLPVTGRIFSSREVLIRESSPQL